MAILEGPREEEFSPVKNPVGNPKDSPDSARAMLTAQVLSLCRQSECSTVHVTISDSKLKCNFGLRTLSL